MNRVTALLVVTLLAGCGGSAATPEPDEPEPTARYTDAEQAAILLDSIEVVHGTDPQPDWYPAFLELRVEDRWAYVTSTLSDPALAESMCHAIAAITYDDESQPIGVTDVLIFGEGGADLADCDIPPPL